MSDERISKLEETMSRMLESGGASIQFQDPRVSSVNRWLYGVFGTVFTGVGIWLVSSVNTLNVNVERLIAQMASQSQLTQQRFQANDISLADLSDRVKDLERNRASR
jgi:hypothetical protein